MAAGTQASVAVFASAIMALTSVPSVARADPPSTWGLAGCTVPVGVPGPTAGQHPEAVFSFAALGDGNRELTVRTGDLEMRQRVGARGETQLHLQAGADEVDVNLTSAAALITRGRARVALALNSPNEAALLAVQQALAGSSAIRRLRAFAADLEPSTDIGPAVAGVAVADALLGFLSGDTGAPGRLAARLKVRRDARMRQVRRSQDDDVGCYRAWEREVLLAWSEYEACLDDFSWWNPLREACTLRYLVWVESAWFQFLGCSVLPFVQ